MAKIIIQITPEKNIRKNANSDVKLYEDIIILFWIKKYHFVNKFVF